MGMRRWQAGEDLREHSVPRSYVSWYSGIGSGDGRKGILRAEGSR